MSDSALVRGRRRRPRIDLGAFMRLTDLADYFVPLTIRAIAELGVADYLADGPRPIAEIARETQTDAPSLYRALRALACRRIFTEPEQGTFALTPLAEYLLTDHPLSLRDAYRLTSADLAAWADLKYSLKMAAPAFDHVHGQNLWAYLADHPAESLRFDRGMQAMTRPELRACLAAYEWEQIRTVVDVGGGNGAFLAGLLAAHPRLHGVLFDLPHVVADAGTVLEESGVSDRCDVVAGSFFDSVPSGADAYVLKRIVYGWDDQRALDVLRTVRAGMSRQSRILLIEPVLRPGNDLAPGKILDLVALVVEGGRARREDELGELFRAAGLTLTHVVPTALFPIVEGRLR
jgi:hypothetical protein